MTDRLLSSTTVDSIAKRTDTARARFNANDDLTHHQMVQLLADLDRLILHANVTISRWTAIRMAVDGETTTRKDTR